MVKTYVDLTHVSNLAKDVLKTLMQITPSEEYGEEIESAIELTEEIIAALGSLVEQEVTEESDEEYDDEEVEYFMESYEKETSERW